MVLLTKRPTRRKHARAGEESGRAGPGRVYTEERQVSRRRRAAPRRQEQRKRTGEGGMHTILDSIVVKRGATARQVQVHRRCRYAVALCRGRRFARCALWRDRRMLLTHFPP